MRVRIRGVIYETVQEAADAFNVKPKQILRRLNEGTLESIALKPEGNKRGLPQPITIEGMTFKNQRAANEAFGLPFNYITQAINNNREKSMERVIEAARAYKEKNQ